MKKQSSTRWRHVLAGAGLLGLTCAFGALMTCLDSYGQTDRAQPAQAIVVLGSRVTAAGQAGNSLRRRALQAVSLYQRGFAPFIICTGGVGHNAPSEAQTAARLIRNQGVPDSAILLEDQSHSTWENVANTTAICRARGWTQVVVVSEPYHLWRAERNFAAFGIQAFPSPAQNPQPRSRILMAARECLSVIRDLLNGR
ncbi:MAG TPA: YdcF family protein [Abditibacteriaceae bacterium]|nr:YdcF family protein [Abditibacteriaceae bacterium]